MIAHALVGTGVTALECFVANQAPDPLASVLTKRQKRSSGTHAMSSSPVQDLSVDFTTRVIVVIGVLSGLSCLAVVVIGGFITATAVKDGIKQVPVEAPIPMEHSQVPSLQLQ